MSERLNTTPYDAVLEHVALKRAGRTPQQIAQDEDCGVWLEGATVSIWTMRDGAPERQIYEETLPDEAAARQRGEELRRTFALGEAE